MKPRVYVETSIPSYLTAQPSHDVVKAARQEITQAWWESRRSHIDLFISQLVLDEASAGDPEAAARRGRSLVGMPLLDVTPLAIALAQDLLHRGPLPAKAAVDALHIAVATVHGMNYLLTWNLTHIANAGLRNRIERVCRSKGYDAPVISTPDELMEEAE